MDPDRNALDAELLRRTQGGDAKAFEELFRAWFADLCTFADRYVHAPDVAEELVQEVFLTLWANRARTVVTSTVRAYLFASVRNRALKHERHQAVARRWEAEAAREPDIGLAADPDALAGIEAAEAAGALHEAIGRLPERARIAVTLRWHRQMSYAEVAEAMGISVKGVEALLTRALRTLRQLMGE